MKNKFAIAIHGGAGTLTKTLMNVEIEKQYRIGLEAALQAGLKILQNNGSALDAVSAAVVSLEDCPLFNAGKGSVFNHQGKHEMDAAVMDGFNLQAGAVTCVSNIRNPILLARCVMEKSEHVLLCGDGAENFAKLHDIQFADDDYFRVEHRYEQWLQMKGENGVALDHNVSVKDKKFGTVGAVAFDSDGKLAAATSTGGMTNKQYGRIGDTPIIGSGTYANRLCAISCTGHGEYFMRAVAAYDVAAMMEYKNLSLEEATQIVVNEKLKHFDKLSAGSIGGEGGLIAVDADGNISMPFNSEGMYRAAADSENRYEILIY